ncbi:MAG TPA: carbonic anhydrase [Candidatus Obscuribacterales bacterium]
MTTQAQELWQKAKSIIERQELPVPLQTLALAAVAQGVKRFQRHFLNDRIRQLFKQLSTYGQHPEVLLIAGSDSRVEPALITQRRPGEIFEVRNVGNVVPHFGTGCSEEAAIEYALTQLKVKDIIIMGHSDCGAVKASPNFSRLGEMPSVARWLEKSIVS